MKKSIFILLVASLLFGCEDRDQEEKSDLDGLWIIQSVKVGGSEMTPNARWTWFHSDSTFESGNGRFQHSYGTWKWNEESNKLSFNTANGLEDLYEPFTLSIQQNKMVWKRTEEGRKIVVKLTRSDKLPETYGDKLLGIWSLKSEDGKNDYLYFRWDKRYILNTGTTRMTGFYQAHAHRPEVVLIPDDHQLERTQWEVLFKDSGIKLRQLNTDSTHIKHLTRIHQFPI